MTLEDKLRTKISPVIEPYHGKLFSSELLDEVSRKVIDAVSNFETESQASVIGLSISGNDNGQIEIHWDSVEDDGDGTDD